MEKGLLVTAGISDKRNPSFPGWRNEEVAEELKDLAVSSGIRVLHEEIVNLKHISPSHYIGTGKAGEIRDISNDLGADVIVFNNDLTGSQQKNLEDIIQIKTVDRTQLILDIFARRAKSNEGKIQVELAQLLYLLPRLIGQGIILSRLGGGIGTRGPGEQKLEVDRRKIRIRISKLKKDLDNISGHRHTSRQQRLDFVLLNIAIIGYTNAGKSTLLNTLTGSNVRAADRLFSTLDATIRSYVLPNNQKVALTDTVGFLDRLPHHLIESFKATLEEVTEADLLIHIIDASHPKMRQHRDAVYDTLKELGAETKTVITVLNKIDKMEDRSDLKRLESEFNNAVSISAINRSGIDRLLDRIVLHLSNVMVKINVNIPHHNMKAIKFLHEHANILNKEYQADYVKFEAELPARYKSMLEKFAPPSSS